MSLNYQLVRTLGNDTFWEMVEPIQKKFTAEAKQLEKEHEKILHVCEPVVNQVFSKLRKKDCEPMKEKPDDDDDDEADGNEDVEGIDLDYDSDEEGVADKATELESDTHASRILNMKRYSFHPLALSEKSISEIGLDKVKKLKAKRKKKRHANELFKDRILASHTSSLMDMKELNDQREKNENIFATPSTSREIPNWRKRARETD